LGRPKNGARYRLAPLSLVALFRRRGIPAGKVNPNSKNVELIVGTLSLQSGDVVVDSTRTLAAGERTTFSASLVPNRPEISLLRFPAFGCISELYVSGIIYHNVAKAENRASLSAKSNEVQAVIPWGN
jgi:hypothetical protein